MIIELF